MAYPITWAVVFLDFNIVAMLVPCGLYCLFHKSKQRGGPTPSGVFLVVYFGGAMCLSAYASKWVSVLAPAACAVAGIGMSEVLSDASTAATACVDDAEKPKNKDSTVTSFQRGYALVAIATMTLILTLSGAQSVWTSVAVYGDLPTIVLRRARDGVSFDDFREAYGWLRDNTPEDAKVVVVGHHGSFPLAAIAFRAGVSSVNMTASESDAHAMARRADADYVLVISGVLVGFEADDIFFAAKPPPPSSLLHRLAHYRVGEVDGTPRGSYDLGRFEEAFTSAKWLVRVFRVLPDRNRW